MRARGARELIRTNTGPLSMPVYLIPIIFGLSGVLFSRQLAAPAEQVIVAILSASLALFSLGFALAKLHFSGRQRFIIFSGMVLLLLGAVLGATGMSDSMLTQPLISVQSGGTNWWIGILSLSMGFVLVLFMMVRTGEDITELAGRFKSLADHMGEGFILSSPDGRILLFNKKLLEMTGLREKDLAGRKTQDVMRDLYLTDMEREFGRRLSGIASEYEVEWNRDGKMRQFWVNGTPVFDEGGRFIGILALLRDITEQRQLSRRLEEYTESLQKMVEDQTQRLRQSEEEYRELLMSMNEGFLTLNDKHRIRFVNDRLCHMLDLPPEQMLGQQVNQYLAQNEGPKLLHLLDLASTGMTSPLTQELVFRGRGGEEVFAFTAVAPVMTSEQDARYSLVVTDITHLKRMQRQLAERADELESVNQELREHDRVKDSFLSNVSHELRTPLSTIQGYVEMLESGTLGEVQASQSGALRVMSRNAERLGGLINEMLEFSRMEIKGIQLKTGLFSIASVVRECISSAHPQCLLKRITMTSEVPDGLPPLWADRGRLIQAVAILLNNAIKFSHEKGEIRVRVSRDDEGGVRLSVEDDGIGICDEDQQRIFMKFFQVDSSMTRAYEGTGLGLSIAKSIAEAHGGTVSLKSEIGKGSAFTIHLRDCLLDAEHTAEDRTFFDRKNILVAAGCAEYRERLIEYLNALGCVTRDSDIGYACLRIARDEPPDLVIMDEKLSDIGDRESFEQLKWEFADLECGVLVLRDTHNSSEVGHELTSSVQTLLKPVDARRLTDTLKELLGYYAVSRDATSERLTLPPRKAEETMRSVLLVGVDADLLDWLEAAFSQCDVRCVAVRDVEEAIDFLRREPFCSVFVDTDVSPDDMIAQVERLRPSSNQPIYALSGVYDAAHAPDAFDGLLRKPFSAREIRALLERRYAEKKVESPQRAKADTVKTGE